MREVEEQKEAEKKPDNFVSQFQKNIRMLRGFIHVNTEPDPPSMMHRSTRNSSNMK